MTPEQLWKKHQIRDSIYKEDFLTALAEYGQAVRERDAEICRERAERDDHAKAPYKDCAAAISREPLP